MFTKKILSHIFILLILFSLFTSCAQMFQEKIPMDTTTQSSTLSSLFKEETEITNLSCPSQLFVSQGLYNNKINILWTAVANASSYKIERAIIKTPDSSGNYPLPEESDFELLNNYIYSTEYTDTIIQNPSYLNEEYSYRYYYRVCAQNPQENLETSEYTDYTSTSYTSCGYLLEPVTTIDAWKGKSLTTIRVTWTKIPNVTNYKIYRTENSQGYNSDLIGTINSNLNFLDDIITESDQAKEFYYTVYAENSINEFSVASPLALGYSSIEGAPEMPSEVEILSGQGDSTKSITISWTASTDDTITYTIYRTSSIDSSYTLLKTGITENSYTDKANLKPGVYYYYYIQAITTETDANGNTTQLKSAISESGPNDETPAKAYLLSPPTEFFIQTGNDASTLILKWSKAIGNQDIQDSYRYNIYSDSSIDGDFSTLLQTISTQDLSIDENGYLYTTVNRASFFCISTINSSDLESEKSVIAAPVPDCAVNIAVSKAENLSSYCTMQANSNNVYPVRITWSAPSTEAPYGYYVYSSTKPDSGFRKITDQIITETSYIDTSASFKPGIVYYYKVLSLNSLSQGINYSSISYGYGAVTYEQFFLEYNKTIKNSQKKLTLMHKSSDTDKLGEETVSGSISGSLNYNAQIAGLGAAITMHYENYSDYYISDDSTLGNYFVLTGNTDTSASMDASGSMSGTVVCTGMYKGTVIYTNIEIKNGGAGGGTYGITLDGFTGQKEISWTYGEQ